jgi:hypothetical protein
VQPVDVKVVHDRRVGRVGRRVDELAALVLVNGKDAPRPLGNVPASVVHGACDVAEAVEHGRFCRGVQHLCRDQRDARDVLVERTDPTDGQPARHLLFWRRSGSCEAHRARHLAASEDELACGRFVDGWRARRPGAPKAEIEPQLVILCGLVGDGDCIEERR